MREILFRGKRLDNGEWVEGSFLRDGEAHRLVRQEGLPFSDCYIVPKTERDNVRTYLSQGILLGVIAYHVDPSTIGQYTGLTDKNGKRIFEGDVVAQSWYDFYEPADDSFGEVVFYVADCSFSVLDLNKNEIMSIGHGRACHYEVEIIGNIHDNPELLEEGNHG